MREVRSVILALFAAVAPGLAHDWLIVSGERVGPVTAKSTEAELRDAFRSAAVTRSNIQIDKKTTAPGIEINRGKPEESLAVVWPRQDKTGLWWPMLVIPCFVPGTADCRWRTASGVRPGVTVADMERMNGKPFRLFPSPMARAWTDPRWDDGRLEKELGEDVELFFDGPDDSFSSGPVYMRTSAEPLAGGARRLRRIEVYLLSTARVSPRNDWAIPGRFWSIATAGTVEQLRETLGRENVHRSTPQAEEGLGDLPGVKIFGGDPHAAVERTLDENQQTFVCQGDDACRWHLEGGIPWKMSLAEANRRNGRAFVFNGFGWDLGGLIRSWEGGSMPRVVAMARTVVNCDGEIPDRMMGEVSLRSDDRGFASLKCTVEFVSF